MSTLPKKGLKGYSHSLAASAAATCENDSQTQGAITHSNYQEHDPTEVIVAALRNYFLTHTFDPITGEVNTFH